MKAAQARAALGGRLKLVISSYEVDEDGEPGFTSFIHSDQCPPDLFSKVRMDSIGRIKEEIDCRSTTKEALFTASGIQGNLEDRLSTAHTLNLAVSGEGLFAMDCPEGLLLTRTGDFDIAGTQIRRGPCLVLARDGRPFDWDHSEIDPMGCTANGSCLALLRPVPSGLTVLDRSTFRADADPFRQPAIHGRLFSDAIETWTSSETGPTGPQWENVPEFHPPANCEPFR